MDPSKQNNRVLLQLDAEAQAILQKQEAKGSSWALLQDDDPEEIEQENQQVENQSEEGSEGFPGLVPLLSEVVIGNNSNETIALSTGTKPKEITKPATKVKKSVDLAKSKSIIMDKQREKGQRTAGTSAVFVDAKLRMQYNRWTIITKTTDKLQEFHPRPFTITELDSALDNVKSTWSDFTRYHESLCMAADPALEQHEYFKDDCYGQALDHYNEAVEIIGTFKSRLLERERQQAAQDETFGGSGLASLQLKEFSGKYSDWQSFSDLFQSMVGSRRIPNVEKLIRLQNALKGEAARILANVPVTAANYESAWATLKAHYENKRLIIKATIDKIYDLPKMQKKSAKGLTHVINTVNESTESLKSLNAPIQHWDLLLTHQIRKLIDVETGEAWELHLGQRTDSPSLVEMMEWLRGRARAWESIEHEVQYRATQASKGNKPGPAGNPPKPLNTARAHVAGQPPKENPKYEKKCAKCNGPHFIGLACPQYRALSPNERKMFLESTELCYNCLGTHIVRKCLSSKRCLSCPKPALHHTSIHDATYFPDKKAGSLGHSRNPPDPHGGSSTSSNSDSLQQTATLSSTEIPENNTPNINQRGTSPTDTNNSTSPTDINNTDFSPRNTSIGTTSSMNKNIQGQSPTNLSFHGSSTKASSSTSLVILATAKALAESDLGYHHDVRILVDQGSELSFISEKLAKELHLPRKKSSVNIIGIGDVNTTATRGYSTLVLKSKWDNHLEIELDVHILSKLTAKLPPFSCLSAESINLPEIQLADPTFFKSGSIEVIIGADQFGKIIENELLQFNDNQLTAQKTIFGWVLSGPVCCTDCYPRSSLSAVRQSVNQQLLDLLRKFWVLEELPTSPTSGLSLEELECERHFQQTHSRDDKGRYIVRLPLKTPATALGESRHIAEKFLRRTSTKLASSPAYGKLYKDFIKEYEDLHHMRLATESEEPPTVYYLPHHGVLREDSATTKLRVVFNGSSKTSTGLSLNDLLHPGPKLQVNASDVLIWFRRHRITFGTDIEKMFRQILVHQDDWDLQRILWKDDDNIIKAYQLQTVTYGTTSAPWLSLRVIQQLVEDEGHRFPLAVPCLMKGRYVDDIYGGADEEHQVKDIIMQLRQLCMAGGLPLQKWKSNNEEIDKFLGISSKQAESSALFEDNSTKILGIGWNQHSDSFRFVTKTCTNQKITKRVVLSEIAQIYDPLGLLAPVVVKAKMFIQQLWLQKLNWDDHLGKDLSHGWLSYREDIQQLGKISIPRWLNLTSSSSQIQIHGFADASNLALGAAVYIRVTSPTGEININLVCAKTRVTPLKKVTIPRLELAAATILTDLAKYVQVTLELSTSDIHLWTDSTVALSWIKGNAARWKEFVQNRVIKIQDTLPTATWHHINGTDNPADCASRGLTTDQLLHHHLWWKGPGWLALPPNQWPTRDSSAENQLSPEAIIEQRAITQQAYPARVQVADELLQRYSTMEKLVRVTATLVRAVRRFRHRAVPPTPIITPQELEASRVRLLKYVQRQHFEGEFNRIRDGHYLPKQHPMAKLTPFLDDAGLLRVGGRLQNAGLDFNETHPAIIPKESTLTNLIIDEAHRKSLHGGTQLTLSHIRQKYWILGGRTPVRSFIFRCIPCTRYRARRAQQLMGELPTERVTPSRPFLHTGVDMAGPFTVLRAEADRVTYKAYAAVFVCMVTSAVHLELVKTVSAPAFIAAFKRFTSRRGICATLNSDNGLNFIGAQAELQRLFDQSSSDWQQIAVSLANDGTEWKFIPPRAPHFGGKWEAAVKSLKHHLRRVIGDTNHTAEEYGTLLCQVEAILNSRPLCPLSEDADDVAALTPGHFLVGEPLTLIPEPSILDIRPGRLDRWQHITQKTQQFWQRWYKECIQRYQARYKWQRPSSEIKMGTLALIHEDNTPPGKWPLGRVISPYHGRDGRIRVAKLRTQLREVVRPIDRLIPLPINADYLEQHLQGSPHPESPASSP